MARIKISDILLPEEMQQVKELCILFNAQWVKINGVIYQAPERTGEE